MSTDDDLTTLLRRGLTQATAGLDPQPDLARIVRRRYVRARRRRLAVAVAVPAAALAAGSGLALAGRDTPNHTPSHTGVAVPRTAPVTPTLMQPASYTVVGLHHRAPPNCPANARHPVGKSANPAGAWFFTKEGTCVFVHIGGADTKPGNAAPLRIKGYPGLFSTLENGVRTIYAPGIGGRGWWVLDMPANTPLDTAVRMLVPAN